MREKRFDVCGPERQRMLLAVKQNEAADPSDIGLLSEMTVVPGAQLAADSIHEARAFHVSVCLFTISGIYDTDTRRQGASNVVTPRYTTVLSRCKWTFLSYTSKLGDMTQLAVGDGPIVLAAS